MMDPEVLEYSFLHILHSINRLVAFKSRSLWKGSVESQNVV